MNNSDIQFDQLVKDIRSIGIKRGDLVNVKASIKSIGNIHGGARTLLNALVEVLGEEGTIVTESFIKMYTKEKQSKQKPSSEHSKSYAGALANEILLHPRVFKSTHPVQRFAAIGGKAKVLMSNHTLQSRPYNVLYEMINQGGLNLRIGGFDKVVGVGTTHVALDYLKIQQKRVHLFAHYKEGAQLKKFPVNWAAGCEEGFNSLFKHYYKGNAVISEGKIGNAESMLTDMEKTYQIELDLINSDLKNILCHDPSCINCNLGYKTRKKKYIKTAWHLLRKRKFDEVYLAFTYFFNRNYQPNIK